MGGQFMNLFCLFVRLLTHRGEICGAYLCAVTGVNSGSIPLYGFQCGLCQIGIKGKYKGCKQRTKK